MKIPRLIIGRIFSFVLLLTFLPLIYAEISISNVLPVYNLGEDVQPKLDIVANFSGFLLAKLLCPDYSNEYYKAPIEILENKIVELPPLPIFEKMLGECNIAIYLEDIEQNIVEEASSEEFKVTELLQATFTKEQISIDPGDKLAIAGKLYNARNDPIPGSLFVTFDNSQFNFTIPHSFKIEIPVPKDIASGNHKLLLSFQDKNKNYKDEFITINIIPDPTSLNISLNSRKYLPSEELKADISLLDQAMQRIQEEISLKITHGKNDILSTKVSDRLFFKINNSLEPGEYVLTASYGKITSSTPFNIEKLQKIDARIEGEKVLITNIGNVPYINTTSVVVTGNGKNYIIAKKLSLNPNEVYEIDLSKEVAQGYYSVTLPSGKVENLSLESEDTGLTSFTGNAVMNLSGIKKFGITILILFLIVGIVVFIYSVRTKYP